MQSEVVTIIRDIAKREGLPFEVVKAVYLSQFECAKNAIKNIDRQEANFKNVRFKRIGLFYVSPRYKEKIKEINNLNKNKEDGNNQN